MAAWISTSSTRRKFEGFVSSAKDACHGSEQQIAARAGQIASIQVYLRAAQAYMLISMPTDTSAIFGVFQVISILPSKFGANLAPGLNLGAPRT